MKEEKKESLERLTFICECHSLDHQVSFWYDEEYDQLYCEPHLTTSNNFFDRVCIATRYIFGYKSTYGAWDSTIFKTKDMVALRQFLEEKY
jgi:hypothetical protein